LARFVKGDIVVVPFPFTDLSMAIKRPALVISELENEDLILCMITSKQTRDRYSISVVENDLEQGKLKRKSNVRPNRLFTANRQIVLHRVGRLKFDKLNEVIEKIVEILKR